MHKLITVIFLFIFSSCSLTKINTEKLDKNKAHFIESNNAIVYEESIYDQSFLLGLYDDEKLFKDKKSSQDLIKESNLLRKKSRIWLGTGLYLGGLILTLSQFVSSGGSGIYLWIIMGVGLYPGIIYDYRATEKAKEAVEDYNVGRKSSDPFLSYSFLF